MTRLAKTIRTRDAVAHGRRDARAREGEDHSRVPKTLYSSSERATVVGCAHADVADEGALRAAPSSATRSGNGAPQCQETLSSREEESILGDSRARTADAIRGSSARGKTTRDGTRTVRLSRVDRAKAVRGRLLETRGTAFASADAVESVRSKVAGSGHGRRVRMRTEREWFHHELISEVTRPPGTRAEDANARADAPRTESERAEARRRGQAMGVESSGSASHPNARTNQRGALHAVACVRRTRTRSNPLEVRRAKARLVSTGVVRRARWARAHGRWRGVRAHWGVLKAALRAREVSCVLDGVQSSEVWRGGATSGMHPDWVQGNEGGALGLTQSRTSVEDGAELSARTARRLRRGELCIVVLGAGESARRIQRRARCGGRYGWCRTLRRAVARLQRLSGGAR
ncbi:hypothetical protein B0H14DRAFT_3658396 [Mycena olivaceomarginata]|nr:hypothetical protein B0H14DRAFT_3658396 [Mycena olivaceomarginata]